MLWKAHKMLVDLQITKRYFPFLNFIRTCAKSSYTPGAVFIKGLKKISNAFYQFIFDYTSMKLFMLMKKTMFFISIKSFIEVVRVKIEKSGFEFFTLVRTFLKLLYKYGPCNLPYLITTYFKYSWGHFNKRSNDLFGGWNKNAIYLKCVYSQSCIKCPI